MTLWRVKIDFVETDETVKRKDGPQAELSILRAGNPPMYCNFTAAGAHKSRDPAKSTG